MATRAIGAQFAPVTNPLQFTLTPGMAPAAPIMRMLARYDRAKVESFVEISISLLDLMDGDSDIEPSGDEMDTGGGEDEFFGNAKLKGSGAGCVLSDPDCAADDIGEECDQEDCFVLPVGAYRHQGPGCPISDDDRADTDA